MKLSRRKLFYALSGCAAGVSGVGIYTWRIEPHWVDVVHAEMPIHPLPAHWNGRRLVHISDLHVGDVVDEEYLIRTFHRIQRLEPDVVVMTGDFVSYQSSRQFDQLARVLKHFPHGKIATVGVLGNHDYGYGWRQPDVGNEIGARAESAGLSILRNRTMEIDSLFIAGLEDLWGPGFNPRQAEDLLSHPAHIALCHNPDTADEPVWSIFQGWILSGHTHGGQCKPPFLPPPLLPVKNKRYTAGKVTLSGGRRLYINRGLGYLMRVRFNVRPEVTVFRLTASA